MDDGMSLHAALTAQHPGKYDFTGRVDGAKKLHLEELKQRCLTFAPVQPGEKPGAEAADAAVYGRSRKRAVIEVLRNGMGYGAFDMRVFAPAQSPPFSDHLPCGCAGAIYEEDEAMNSTQILEEMQSSPDYYRSLLAPGDQLPESTTEINQLLASCMQPLKSIQLDAPVDAVMVGRGRKRFFLVQTVIDELTFLDVEDRLDLLPPSVSRQGSLADIAPGSSLMPLGNQRSSSLESVSSARDVDEDTMDEFIMAPCAFDDNLEEFNRNMALAFSNSEIHTYGNGAYATDGNGAGPSGV